MSSGACVAGSEPAVDVALDGPIIDLDEIDALDLLADFTALAPEAVWAEVGRHRPRALDHSTLASSRCPAPHDERVAALASVFGLGAGEREALALARLRGCMVFTDDAAARLAAESLGLRVHGTLGVLIRATRSGVGPLAGAAPAIDASSARVAARGRGTVGSGFVSGGISFCLSF